MRLWNVKYSIKIHLKYYTECQVILNTETLANFLIFKNSCTLTFSKYLPSIKFKYYAFKLYNFFLLQISIPGRFP